MTVKFSGFRAVVEIHVLQNFMELSAAVHELPCAQRKNSDENNRPRVRRHRTDSKENTNYVLSLRHGFRCTVQYRCTAADKDNKTKLQARVNYVLTAGSKSRGPHFEESTNHWSPNEINDNKNHSPRPSFYRSML